ncbi:MAG: SH3 domain-containing protein [Pseudomonadota bacterium]
MKRPPISAALNAVRTVTEAHEASYANPIRVRRGDALFLQGREDDWDGHRWLWAEAHGREGWIPDDLPSTEGSGAVARWDYSALEMTVAKGQRVAVARETHGWAWCIDDDGDEGWVPERCLGEED